MKNLFLEATSIDREHAAPAATLDATRSLKPLFSDKVVGEGHPAAAHWRPPVRGEHRLDERGSLSEFMGPSRHVERIVQQVTQVAGSPLTVLIQGETGTGKELVARAIHNASHRRTGPFIALDCGAIPETLIESELFGHEKGAFTGADQRTIGHIQLAEGGSLYLDELVNLPLTTQVKLLRVLQERVVQPLGGRRPVPVDVRIIATSNLSVDHEMNAGRFRQDLYYRINEFTITLPALRERIEDILYLANRFLTEARQEFGRTVHGISDDAAQVLVEYHWPGNVRQLRSIIRQAALLAFNSIEPEHLVGFYTEPMVGAADTESHERIAGHSLKVIAAAAAADAERRAISHALVAMKGNKSAVARWLEIDYKTLLIKLKRYGMCGHELDPA
jgi:two-component system nitrogen regulation response regulator GlnG